MPLEFADNKIIYKCKCGKDNCKLWRRYQVMLDGQELYCFHCALINQNKKWACIDAKGMIELEGHKDKSDQIRWLIPAVPTVERDIFWGYGSVPEELVKWWKGLNN